MPQKLYEKLVVEILRAIDDGVLEAGDRLPSMPLLEADLVELVARRKVLELRAQAASKAGKVDDLKLLIAELKALPTQPQYQQRIDLSRTTAVEGAREKKDQVAEARIRKMYTTLAESAKTHLDDEKFQQTLKDLQDIAAIRSPDAGKKK